MKRRGIGSEPGYDAYFGLHPSSDAIPKSVLDGIIARLDDEEALVAAIEPYLSKLDRSKHPLIGQLLEEVRARFQGRGHADPTQPLLNTLFRLGEQMLSIESRPDLFTLSVRSQLSFAVTDLLELWGPQAASEHLSIAFDKSTSPAMCADIFVDRARELGEIPGGERSSSPKIEIDGLKLLGEKLLPLIEMAEQNRTLSAAPFYWDIAHAWKYLAGPEKVKNWISEGVDSSANFLAKVTKGLVSYSVSSRGRSYSMRERPDESIYDLNNLLRASRKHLNGNELDDDQRNRIGVVADALEKMLSVPKPTPA